jgi:hypothetical protein
MNAPVALTAMGSAAADARRPRACRQVTRSLPAPRRSWDEQSWPSFVSGPEVPPIMKEAAHKGKPQAAEFAGRYDA